MTQQRLLCPHLCNCTVPAVSRWAEGSVVGKEGGDGEELSQEC